MPSSATTELSIYGDDLSTGVRRDDIAGLKFATRVGGTAVAGNTRVDKGLRRKSSEKITVRGRQNSLRRAKNSTDLLRERSLQRQRSKKDPVIDATSNGREARQFTVGNVGNNGMIYLRPVKKVAQQPPPHQVPPIITPASQTNSMFDQDIKTTDERHGRDSVWTHLSTPNRYQRVSRTYPPIPNHKRSMSQSTIDAQLTNERLESGAFKIVIERADSVITSDKDQRDSLPTLEVPIPHYRLGEPRFSARGTAFLHNSVYTQSSTHEEFASSLFTGAEYDRLFPRPPGMESRSVLSRRHSHASPQPWVQSGSVPKPDPTPQGIPSQKFHRSHEPILPHIYDALAANPDDPTIVKYSTSGEIVAATPARIVAQVTSENFLDYELLSDFFLTVRAYLSTQDLLSYLVARFEWAINRFDDNGRVIRVRAFAALRHWILNYFFYDFVFDRDLRVQFCDRLNNLTGIVQARANYGASDMKLISDLKKCWNGRCMLYWDSPVAAFDNQREGDIYPGGIAESRDGQLTHPSQLSQQQNENGPNLGEVIPGSAIAKWYGSEAHPADNHGRGHIRQVSGGTVRSLPISPTSEKSIPAMSCSIPGKGFKKITASSRKVFDVHPVPASPQGRRLCPAAPSSQANDQLNRPTAGHRRSGSFSDAARDNREPLSSDRPGGSNEYVHLAYQYAGSLIRGNIVTPAPPYVNVLAPLIPESELPGISVSSRNADSDPTGNRRLNVPSNPGVKNLLGNIRRALSSKHGPSSLSANLAVSTSSHSMSRNASSPVNVYQPSSAGQLDSMRSDTRIDLLAAEVADAFHQLLLAQSSLGSQRLSSVGVAYGNEREQPSPNRGQLQSDLVKPTSSKGLKPPQTSRLHSGVTSGSQSILIVDDTGLPAVPTISGVLVQKDHKHAPKCKDLNISRSAETLGRSYQAEVSPLTFNPDTYIPETAQSQPHAVVPGARTSPDFGKDVVASEKHKEVGLSRPSAHRVHSSRSTKSGSISLRRYASFQSTFTKHARDKSVVDAINTTELVPGSINNDIGFAPSHKLRRRPGGDLRANENVHDMENMPRPRSAGSLDTYSDSMRGSEALNLSHKLTKTVLSNESPRVPDVPDVPSAEVVELEKEKSPSFVRTHSSQPALRCPSFDAAVAEFARIPDDDEGGIEATYLKLEGKYQKSPAQSPVPPEVSIERQSPNRSAQTQEEEQRQSVEKQKRRREHLTEDPPSVGLYPLGNTPIQQGLNIMTDETPDVGSWDRKVGTIASTIYADSEESYNSVPLLERGLEERSNARGFSTGKERATSRALMYRSQLSDEEAIDDSESTRKLKHGSYAPTATTDSFLLDEDDDFLSDLSSELSNEDVQAPEEWMDSTYQGHRGNAALVGEHPPTPPHTMANALSINSHTNQAQEQRRPPTPDPSPVSQHAEPHIPNNTQPMPKSVEIVDKDREESRHMPFILGYDSRLLAEQFTIIEKDALNEIDWRDLVDKRWKDSAPPVTSWVDYLRIQEPQGIDLVTARFNIMVKWAISELVLTKNIEERACSIVKYIHIAQQCRKIHNYATLLQLTIAVTSVDCIRLTKTWDLVPPAEKKILAELEELVTPRRNFQNLRSEMEKTNTNEGCVPVVALYIHDLTSNSQKPAQIPNPINGEPLINFERYRSTALIVKNLLRLIDASTKYNFQPVESALQRCLWMAALPDDTIRLRSKGLE